MEHGAFTLSIDEHEFEDDLCFSVIRGAFFNYNDVLIPVSLVIFFQLSSTIKRSRGGTMYVWVVFNVTPSKIKIGSQCVLGSFCSVLFLSVGVCY